MESLLNLSFVCNRCFFQYHSFKKNGYLISNRNKCFVDKTDLNNNIVSQRIFSMVVENLAGLNFALYSMNNCLGREK